MPASAQSLRITEHYRAQIAALTAATQRDARAAWAYVKWDDLRASYVPVGDLVAVSVRRAQTEAVRLTAGYLGAYLSSELGERVATPAIRSADYVDRSYGGLPLRESLDSPILSVLKAIKAEKPEPMAAGAATLRANVDLDVKATARQALLDAIKADDRMTGWRRAVRGTCGACAAKADEFPSGEVHFEVHPDCQCVTEPVVPRIPTELTEKAALGLTAEEERAVLWYQQSGYLDVNNALRGRGIPDSLTKRTLAGMDSAFGKAPALEQSGTVYRGTHRRLEAIFPDLTGDIAGTVIDDPAFASTSLRKKAAENFTTGIRSGEPDFGDLWEINAPEGTKMLDMGTRGEHDESEVLLNRGTKYKIVGVKQTDTYRLIRIEVLP